MTVSVSKGHNWAKIRQDAKDAVDKRAEWARSKVMTMSLGQDYIYREKIREAEAYLTPGGNQSADNYPFLSAEAQIDGTSLGEAANVILSKRQRFNLHLASIEFVRRTAKNKIDAAPDRIDEISQIVDQTVYPPLPKFLTKS